MKVFGLQTFIWQNNLKSIILLIIFPVIITFLGFVFVFTFNLLTDNSGGYQEDGAVYTSDEKEDLREYYDAHPYAKVNMANDFREWLYEEDDLVVEEEGPLEKTISSFPLITPFFLGGVGLWFFIAWTSHKGMISRMTHSNPLDRKTNPRVYNIVENLCISRGLPVPEIYVIEDSSLNAYATGLRPKDAVVVFSRGLIEKLDDGELEAVAAHELTHIRNYDIRLMVIAIIFVGIITTMSEAFLRMRIRTRSSSKKSGSAILMILLLKALVFVIGFFITLFVQAAISRKREYLADAGSVELTKSSQPLISALKKIDQDPMIEAVHNRSVAQMFIDNPLSSGKGGIMARLLSTHPPIKDRIKALEMMG